MGAWPDLDAYKAWARVPDTVDDAAITAALDAATAAVLARCPSLAAAVNPLAPTTPLPSAGAEAAVPDPGPGAAMAPGPDCPPDVAQAILLWTNRLVARRNSPSGVVGLDETGQAIVPGRDPDIARLLAPWKAAVAG